MDKWKWMFILLIVIVGFLLLFILRSTEADDFELTETVNMEVSHE